MSTSISTTPSPTHTQTQSQTSTSTPHSSQAPEGSITNHTPSPTTQTLLHTLQSSYSQARANGLSPSAAAHLASTHSPPTPTPHPSHPSKPQPPNHSPLQLPHFRSKLAHLSASHAKIAACRHRFLASYQRAKTAKLESALRNLFATQYDPLYRPPAPAPSTGGGEPHPNPSPLLGCKHYARNCKIRAKCCGLFVSCRFCHDEAVGEDHEIDRFATDQVLCMLCLTQQPVGERCVSCGERFAHWFCAECRFYENTPGKKVYHCDRCKICRLGEGLGIDNYHCDNCDACVSLSSRDRHRCMSKALHTNCPVCKGYLFTSTEPVFFMRCGHTMHKKCFEIYTAKRYQCPLCMRSLKNMTSYFREIDEHVRNEPMPPEYDNKRSLILCNDCGTRSWVKYHFNYHKCPAKECEGSYNTVVLKVGDVGGGMSATPAAAMAADSGAGGAVLTEGGDECPSGEDGQRAKPSVPWQERG